MKIVIASLQVSEAGSKGHLHPALELALELKRRGHELFLLPTPNPLGEEDERHVAAAGIPYVNPPPLPAGVAKTAAELAALAAFPERVHKAYRSFLVDPLEHQFEPLRERLKTLDADAVVYDLLAYGPALAAKSLGIPEVGFCAGLKLAAPDQLQSVYASVRRKLKPAIDAFIAQRGLRGEFHHLELLSENRQLVFGLPRLFSAPETLPPRTTIVGPLPPSRERGDDPGAAFDTPKSPFGILCFGSVLDPAGFPQVTEAILRACEAERLPLIISSKTLSLSGAPLPALSRAYPYVPLPRLLPKAAVLFHHGGANTFSEACHYGTPQVLIPLTTDQPVQAELLRRSGAGFPLSPHDAPVDRLRDAVRRSLDCLDPVHMKVAELARDYRAGSGIARAATIIEQAAARTNVS